MKPTLINQFRLFCHCARQGHYYQEELEMNKKIDDTTVQLIGDVNEIHCENCHYGWEV